MAVGQLYTEGHGVLHLMNAKGFLLILALDAVFSCGLVRGKQAALVAIQAVMRHEIPL